VDIDIQNLDAASYLRKRKDKSINTFLVSCPYGQILKYQGFKFDFEPIADEMARTLANGGCILWNEFDQQRNFDFSGDSFRHALYFQSLGLSFCEQVVIEKNAFVYPRRGYGIGFTNHEYMWVFSKNRPKLINPIVDRPNRKAGKLGEGTNRRAEDESTVRSGKPYVIQPYGKRGSVWRYEVGGGKTGADGIKHPGKMNLQLAIDALKTWGGNPSKSVCADICLGSGTTGVAAKVLGFKNFLGCDVSEEYCKIAKKRIKTANMLLLK